MTGTSGDVVERFYVVGTEVKSAKGDFVHYSDYTALLARVEELEAALKAPNRHAYKVGVSVGKASAQPEPDPVKAVFVRSQAIRDFCEAAGIKASVQVAHLPDDVKRFRAEAAINHKRALRSLSEGEG